MGIKVANNAFATLAAGISNSDTSITVSTGQGARFPVLGAGDYFYATLINTSNQLEIVECTARSGDVLTVVRAQESTAARAYDVGDRIEIRITAQTFIDATDVSAELALKQDAATAVTKDSTTGAALMPVGTTAQRPASPVEGMFRLNTTTTEPEWYDEFSGEWVSFRVEPVRTYSVEYLVVAGGGGTAEGGGSEGSGGGGAGGLLTSTSVLTPGTAYSITVGAGGAGGGSAGSNGTNSVFNSLTAIGGGNGGRGTSTSGVIGGSGGSGGGSGAYFTSSGGSGTTGQGSNGGAGFGSSGFTGGGGGGASSAGANGTNTFAGNGGAGTASSITGSSATYAGGGGGGAHPNAPAGTGGAGGGGNGGRDAQGTAGTANTGGGGGGSGGSAAGAAGGSGIVIIRYAGAQRGTGGTVTSSGGFTIHTFTSSGTYTA